MLAVLEQAQAAGQKSQQDALIGQGSIFDLGPTPAIGGGGNGGGFGGALSAPSHAPIPGEEFDRTEMLAAEKESLGLFISAHPLKEVGPGAGRPRPTARSTELCGRRDGDWVTIGGMVTQFKKIKTKKGDLMAFATIYDLEASVEIVVFGKVLDACGDALETDSIVLVRGKVDHKDRDKTCLIAQQVEKFEPSEAEVLKAQVQAAKPALTPAALRLCLDATALPADGAGRAQGCARRLPRRVRRRDRADHHRRAPPAQARPELPRHPHPGSARRA